MILKGSLSAPFCFTEDKMENIIYRKAEKSDIPDMLSLIKELAAYEHLEHEAKAMVSDFEKWMFEMISHHSLHDETTENNMCCL